MIFNKIRWSIDYAGMQKQGFGKFKWYLTINKEVFEYYTNMPNPKDGDRPSKTPKFHEILEAIIMDMECGKETFFEFCTNLGYDTDSRKALDIYLKCQENGIKLQKALGKYYHDTLDIIHRYQQEDLQLICEKGVYEPC